MHTWNPTPHSDDCAQPATQPFYRWNKIAVYLYGFIVRICRNFANPESSFLFHVLFLAGLFNTKKTFVFDSIIGKKVHTNFL